MANVPMLDITAITPEMARAAGINPNRLQSQLGDPSTVPITQADREELGRIRNRKLRQMKIAAMIMFVTSLIAIVVGCIAFVFSVEFPYKMGGAAWAGIAGLIACLCSVCLVHEGKKTPTGSETTSRFIVLVKVYTIIGIFMIQVMMVAFGMSGIWGIVECIKREPSDDHDTWSFNSCHPDKSMLLALSVLTLILSMAVIILFMVSCCAFWCNSRAFGVKTGYERLLDLQMAQVAEMQRLQQQRGEANMYGQQRAGWQGQDHRYQPLPQETMSPLTPSAPPAPPPTKTNFSDEPPSYRDVMEM